MDATFWALVALIIFVGIIFYVKVPNKIGLALDKRADTIRDNLDAARKAREEAQSLLALYQRKRQDAEKEAEEIVASAKREADILANEAKQKIDDYITRRTKVAEQKIAQAEQKAIQDVKALAADRAIAASEIILRDKLATGGADLIKSSIAEVKNRLI